jgi:hypothetical protein
MKRMSKFVMTMATILLLVPAVACTTPTPTTPTATTSPTTPTVTPPATKGAIEIQVTDPPPANVKSAIVYLTNLEVHRASDNQSDNDSGGEWILVSDKPLSFDLMKVIGVEESLASANISTGKYTQIRMNVEKVEGVTTDNKSYTAEVPSEKLRIVGPFSIESGAKTVLTLDFDGEKSLALTGQGKAMFKPVVKLLIAKGKP